MSQGKRVLLFFSYSQNLRQFFEEAFAFIDLARRDRSGVLIHCHAGVSRSPTIAVAYLMKRYPMAMSDAYKFVKKRRSIISPNLNFMGQLWEFEQGLRTEAKKRLSSLGGGKGKKEETTTLEEEDEDEEDLSVEMKEVAESLTAEENSHPAAAASVSSSSSTDSNSSGSGGETDWTPPLASAPPPSAAAEGTSAFRWSDQKPEGEQDQQQQQQPVSTGCGV